MSMRPRILLTTSTGYGTDLKRHDAVTGRNYSQAIARAGGLPLMVASLEPGLAGAFLEGIDGIVFTGGVDVHPQHFGHEPLASLGQVDMDRDLFELALYAAARKRDLPVLGVCRGHQLINIAEGGTIHQHLGPDLASLDHSQKNMEGEPHHRVNFEPDSILARAFGTGSILTNSYHHQAVDRPADSVRVTARTSDGVVEAIEGRSGAWLLGVQWHPEMSQARHEQQLAPFTAFIRAVSEARSVPI